VNKCLNLTVNPTGDGAATCTCWADSALAADVAAVKACNRKLTYCYDSNINSFKNGSVPSIRKSFFLNGKF
jgi:hypothetical protein